MTKTTIGLSGYLLLWLAIFLGKTLYPHAQGFYQGIRGTADAWPGRFREYEQFQRFIALTSPRAATANGRVLFAFGGGPVPDGFMGAIQYLLYPTRMYSSAIQASTPISHISHIAVYQTKEEVFDRLPFCQQVGERNYLCEVRPAQQPLPAAEVHARYQAPDLTIRAQVREAGGANPAFLLVSFKEVPIRYSPDWNVLLPRQSSVGSPPEEAGLYRLHLTVEAPPLPVYRFQLLMVDKRGLLSASEEQRLVFAP